MTMFLNSSVTLFPILSCVSSLTQTLQMPLLYGILIVTNRLPPSLFVVTISIYLHDMTNNAINFFFPFPFSLRIFF